MAVTSTEDLKRGLEVTGEDERNGKKAKTEESQQPTFRSSGITEADVGILSTIYQGEGKIFGKVKARYTDFMVNEVSVDGEVIHLLDEGFPTRKQKREEEREKPKEEEQEKPEIVEKPKEFELDENHKAALTELLGEDIVAKMLNLVNTGSGTVDTEKSYDDKDKRTKIHRLCREAFKGRIETITTETNSFQMGINSRAGGNFNANRSRNKNNGSGKVEVVHNLGPPKKFIHFSVYKENKETMEVAGLLAKLMKLPVKWIKYAGTKDRRGVTVQKFSIGKLTVERLNNLNKILKGIRIGGFEYHNDSLRLGDLKGNEFIITIKNVQSTNPDSSLSIESQIAPILESMKTRGFINYFGMQRFGTFSISTHEVGKEILQNNWGKAAELILSEQDVVVPDSIESRKIWKETKDPLKALKKMPRRCSAEYSVLTRLASQPKEEDGTFSENAYFNAIMGIPRNLRIMYGHAYQSYVWNCVASARVEKYGLEPVLGDLVIDKEGEDDSSAKKDATADGFDEDDEDDFIEDIKTDSFVRARPITQEEIDSNKFTIYDIVLPTPGFDVVYPSNDLIKQQYVDVMARDNLDPFQMSRRVREFSLAGSYRHVVAKPENLEYFIRKYKEETDSLVKTDLELLKLKQAQASGSENSSQSTTEINRISDDIEGGEKTAVIIKMQLGTSTYATMALRELLAGTSM